MRLVLVNSGCSEDWFLYVRIRPRGEVTDREFCLSMCKSYEEAFCAARRVAGGLSAYIDIERRDYEFAKEDNE